MAEEWESKIAQRLPENAYRELKEGEEYVPMVPPDVKAPEITMRSILFGTLMNIFFAMAATLLALKIGQAIETAIPISILAVWLSGMLLKWGYRRSTLLENINVLAIGTTSGIVAGGTCFTMPAIYILNLHGKLGISTPALFLQIFLVPFLGAVLGVVFLVPFRRYFVKQMHGKLPFPEGTATNEILVSGAKGGEKQGWILLYSLFLAMVYNFVSMALKLFPENFTTGIARIKVAGKEAVETLAIKAGFFEDLTYKIKAIFSMGTGAYYLGLGFIIGLRYASIICAGSFLSYFVIVPLLSRLPLEQLQMLNPEIHTTTAEDIWHEIPRVIGIGGIFTAGLLSILKMSKVIFQALTQALGGLFRSKGGPAAADRTDEDISYPSLLILGILVTVGMALYFRYSVFPGMENPTWLTLISVLLALGISFLFITVSAWAIAMISVTPISGMTVTTIIITAVLLLAAGLPKGDGGMLAVLLVGGVVCTALSMAGTLVTEFKLGYWLGASPRKICWSAIIASFFASAAVTGAIMILAKAYGFTGEGALAAPQANMMSSALQSFIGTGEVPWLLYGLGVVVALIVELVGISALAFALGMYLPMEINTPILIGAFVAVLVQKTAKGDALARARKNKGILIASGLVAGAAFIDVIIGFVKLIDEWAFGTEVAVGDSTEVVGVIMPFLDVSKRLIDGGTDPETLARFGNWLGLFMFLGLCAYMFWDCRRARADDGGPDINM
jgi:putative OPT family oligopeptide transporter